MKIGFLLLLLVFATAMDVGFGEIEATLRQRQQQVRIDDFIKRVFVKNTRTSGNVVYLILSCEEDYLTAAVRLMAGLNSTTIASSIVTVPIDEQTVKPLLFAKNVEQVPEVLENYACFINIEQSPRYENVYAIIRKILPFLHKYDSVLLLTPFHQQEANENDESESTLVEQQLLSRAISVHILLLGDSNLPAKLEELATKTAGYIFAYSHVDDSRHSFQSSQTTKTETQPEPETQTENFTQPIYKIETRIVEKELTQQTRTLFQLPEHTFQIFLTLYGDVEKASLITPSGIVINVLPIDADAQLATTSRNRSINFNSLLHQSPTTLSLSATGRQYHVTFMTLAFARSQSSSKYKTYNNEWSAAGKEYGSSSSGDDDDNKQEQEPKQEEHGAGGGGPVALQQRWTKRQDFVEFNNPLFDEQLNLPDIQNGNAFDHQPTNLLPTLIDVDLQSTFFALPGEEATFILNVKNNKPFTSEYHFGCIYYQRRCQVFPNSVILIPQQSIRVSLLMKAQGTEGSSNTIIFVSQDTHIIYRKIYLYIGKQKSDSDRPDIDYEYSGNCDDANAGNTCHRKRWNAEVLVRDAGSGLLNVWSEPPGLFYMTEFIVGTKDAVTARYSASCCDPKVDILGMDIRGNFRKITLDVEHQYLNWIEITALVMGAALLFLLFAILVYLGLRWRRKRNERSFLNN